MTMPRMSAASLACVTSNIPERQKGRVFIQPLFVMIVMVASNCCPQRPASFRAVGKPKYQSFPIFMLHAYAII